MTRVNKSIRVLADNDRNILAMMKELDTNYSETVNLILTNYFTNKNPNEKNITQLFTTLASHLENSKLFKKHNL